VRVSGIWDGDRGGAERSRQPRPQPKSRHETVTELTLSTTLETETVPHIGDQSGAA